MNKALHTIKKSAKSAVTRAKSLRTRGTTTFANSRVGQRTTAVVQSTLFVRFSIKDQTLFAKRLAFLVKAGVPIVECLHLIRSQTKSAGRTKVFDAIIADVSNGQYLSTSLGKFKRLFGDFTINLIRVGETSGVLSQNLVYLADELAKKQALQRKVLGAMVYPIFITVATFGVTGLITVYIFPKIMPIFTSLHVDLPLTTRILIAMSVFLKDWGVLAIVVFLIALIAFFIVRSRFEPLRYAVDNALLHVPIVSSLMRAYNFTNICRTLGLLLRSGLYLSDSMIVVAETTKNRVYKKACEDTAANILKGEPVSRSLALHNDVFPDMLTHMIMIGETTGNLPGTLTYLAEMYEGEVDELTKSLSSSIEPVLMVVMGVLVGLIAVSVITPIYAITQHLNPRQ